MDRKTCPKCGTEINAGDPHGLCPACLLIEGLETSPSQEGGDPVRTSVGGATAQRQRARALRRDRAAVGGFRRTESRRDADPAAVRRPTGADDTCSDGRRGAHDANAFVRGPAAVGAFEEAGAVAEKQGNNVDFHLVDSPAFRYCWPTSAPPPRDTSFHAQHLPPVRAQRECLRG